jgi:hypothetical protein
VPKARGYFVPFAYNQEPGDPHKKGRHGRIWGRQGGLIWYNALVWCFKGVY